MAAVALALIGSADAGVFKVPVYQSGAEGYNIYRIPTMVKAVVFSRKLRPSIAA